MSKQNIQKTPPKGNIRFSISLSDEQKLAKQAILHHPYSFVVGKAGSGKTLLACQIALDMFLPDYSISILLTQFLLMALVLYSVSFFVITFLISNQYELKTLLPLLYCIILAIILNYVLVVLGYGLYGIAYSKVIVFGIYSVIIFRLYLKIIEEKFFKNIFSIFIRLALFLAPLTIIVYEKMPLYYVFILFLFIYSHTLIKFIQIILLPFVNSYKEQP